MLSSRVLVGISLAVWNSFAAYQVATSTAAGEMGNPKTYGYGLALATGLTAVWIWSGILNKESLEEEEEEEEEEDLLGTKENLEFKFTSPSEALEYVRWKKIVGLDIYKEGAWEIIQQEKAKAQATGKKVSKNKIKNKILKLGSEPNKIDPDYIPKTEDFDELRFPRKININYGVDGQSNLEIIVPPVLKYDGVVEEAVFLQGGGKTEVTLGLSFLQETSARTYYPFVLKVKGIGNDYTQATRMLQKNINFVLNAEPWDDFGNTPIDIDNDGSYDLVITPRGNIKKPWWTEKRSEERSGSSENFNLPEIPWNLEYVPNARLSNDSWSLGSPAKSSARDLQKLEKEIRQNIHTNQFLEVGCPICGSINQFTRKVSDNGIRYNCQDCMYTSGEHYVSLKSRGDKTLADFGMNTLCGVCGESVNAYTNSQFKRHLKSCVEKIQDEGSENFSAENKVNDNYEKTYGKKGARIRRRIKKELMEENVFGTKSGQWSARKSQELKRRYESAMNSKGLKPYASSARSTSQKDLSRWTKQDWSTASGKKSSITGEPYFPAKAVAALKKEKLYKKARAQKRKATRLGKQRATYSPDIQAIVANYRSEENQPDIQKVLELPPEGSFE